MFNQVPQCGDVWKSGDVAPCRHDLALNEGECSELHLGSVTSGEGARGKYWTGGWVGPGAGLDAADRTNIFAPAGNRNLIPWLFIL